MQDLIDNKEVNEVMEILENMADEQLAVTLLREFNDKTKQLGQMIVNKDQELDHANWKVRCDELKKEVDSLVAKIKLYK